jgi:hypothetical protein
MSSVFTEKTFPDNYDGEVVDVIELLSYKKAEIVGSSSLKSQLYAADYDLNETIRADNIEEVVSGLKRIVVDVYLTKGLYLGDIKCGRIVEWEVISPNAEVVDGKIRNYSSVESQRKLDALRQQNIITQEEYDEASSLLGDTKEEFLIAKKEIKFDTIRWKYEDVKRGFVVLRDGRQMTMEDAIQTPGLVKIDCVGWVQNSRYSEFSCLYSIYVKGKWVNPVRENIVVALKNDILYNREVGNYFKYAKRIFSLVRYRKRVKDAEQLTGLLNSELGRLYQLIGDVDTLLYLLENEKQLDKERIQYELRGFAVRLGSIYSTETIAKIEPELLQKIRKMTKLPKGLEGDLERLKDTLEEGLNEETEKELRRMGWLPTPKQFLP